MQLPYSIDDALRIGVGRNKDLTGRFSYALDSENTMRRDDAWSFERVQETDHAGFRLYLSMSGITRFSKFHVSSLPRKYLQTPWKQKERARYNLTGRKPAFTVEVDFDDGLERVLDATFYHSTVRAIPLAHHYRRPGTFRPTPELGAALYVPGRDVLSLQSKTIPLALEKEFLYLTKAKSTDGGVHHLMLLWRELYRRLLDQHDAYAIRKHRTDGEIVFSEEPIGDGYISSTSPLTRMVDSFNLGLGDSIVTTSRPRFAKSTILRFKQFLEGEEEKRRETLRKRRELELLAA